MKRNSISIPANIAGCRNTVLSVLTLLFSILLTMPSYAQRASEKPYAKSHNVHEVLHKRTYNGEYPLPNLPMASEVLKTSGAKDALGQPLSLPERVWFPGEWEEVKAIVVTVRYIHQIPDHVGDPYYGADPLVPDYGTYYKYNPLINDFDIIGEGPYITTLDVETDSGKVFLNVIDAIQRGGAKAWVRIEKESDEDIVREAMEALQLRTDNIHFFVARGNSYWFRDCGPICFYYGDNDDLAMLDFFYGSGRPLDDLLPSVLHREMGIPNYSTDIKWEGGNCLVDGAGALVTSSAVYANNKDTLGPVIWDGVNYNTISKDKKTAYTTQEVKSAFYDLIGHRAVYTLNRLNNDGGTGHVDLYADAINENGFIFTNMPNIYNLWSDYDVANINISYMLQQENFWGRRYYDMGIVPFPARDDGSPFRNEEEYNAFYTRSYANHLIVNDLIVQPCFSPVGDDFLPTAEWDRNNILDMKKAYPGYKFYCIDMRPLDHMGGSIHCITKQIPVDNPIRFLHKNIHDTISAGQLQAIPFTAIITNKSGIKSAQLIYRVGGGEWQTVNLNANGNCWYCSVPVSQLGNEQTVEYYFKATSNNDKTSTKPLTAGNGGYYNFTLSDKVYYDETMFDFYTEPVPKDKITFLLNTQWLTEDTSTKTETGIREVASHGTANKTVREGWYTINGLRLSTPPTEKGIYIHNGQKVIID